MVASIVAPVVASLASSVVTSFIQPSTAPAPNPAGASRQMDHAAGSRPPGHGQNHIPTHLGKILLQGNLSQLCNSGMNAKHAKGAGIALGGMAAQEVGKNLANSSGTLSRVLGALMTEGGKAAQLYGAGKFGNA